MVDKPHLDEEALAELQDVMEDEFETLIHTYLSDSRERIESLKAAMNDGDADAVAKTAHSFKGSCINIGATRLGVLCREVEKAGIEDRLGDAQPALGSIEEEFQRVTEALHALMAGGAR